MKKSDRILSKRYADDGRAEEYLTKPMSDVVKTIRKEMVSGGLERHVHEKCPLCAHTEAFLIAKKDRLGLPVDTVVCEKCGLVFSDSYFSDAAAGAYYGKYCNQLKNRGRTAEELFLSRTAPTSYSWRRYRWVQNKLGKEFEKVRTVMEIGCNDGCNLFPYQQNGIKVYGCDFDDERMDAGRRRGLELFRGGVEKLQEAGKKADLVIFSHALEHMPDVDQALQQALRILSDDGLIYVEVPGMIYWNRPSKISIVDDWISSGNNFLLYLQAEHNYCFEWQTLSLFAARDGLTALTSDEFVHALFKRDKGKPMPENQVSRGASVLSYLLEVERDWERVNPLWKRMARRLKQSVLALKKQG